MGLYEKQYYKKDKNGNWKPKGSPAIEKCPHDEGRWRQSCKLEEVKGLGEKTYLSFSSTATGINRKVTQVRCYFGDGTKVVRKLITTANKLPKGHKAK